MERITFKNILFFAKHGAFQEERTLGQRFALDLTLFFDASKAIENDDLKETVDYENIFNEVFDLVTNQKHHLIETLADKIARLILANHKIVKEVIVCLRKPNAPVNGIFDYIEVEVRRKSEDIFKFGE
ncbi:dihydroneopterin aldolase [bacterium]|nr:dihydroneopterin aldolase [bacterium]